MDKFLLILNFASTLCLTGLIWVIQIVQYPFFSYFKAAEFQKYHDEYRFWITPVAAPLMLAELFSSILLVIFPPPLIDAKILLGGLLLVIFVWLSTFFIQVPLHEKLAAGFDEKTHRALVNTNWIRTFLWTLRAALVICLMWRALEN